MTNVIKDMSGHRFGRLIAVLRMSRGDGVVWWQCICDCGRLTMVRGYTLRNGRSKSCGCLPQEIASSRFTTHGATAGGKFTPEYRSYKSMRERCLNPNHLFFKNYGGRGVTICPRWMQSFASFLADMGQRPTAGHSLDRVDPFGNYEPSNCRWATRAEQASNTRKQHRHSAALKDTTP